jgi:hypothetical protein
MNAAAPGGIFAKESQVLTMTGIYSGDLLILEKGPLPNQNMELRFVVDADKTNIMSISVPKTITALEW